MSGSRKRDQLNLSALDARNNITAILESWSALVAEKLGTLVPDRTVPHLVRFLALHLEWLTAQPPATDFADEIEGLRAELARAIDPDSGDLRTPARQCVVDGCTGTIDATPKNIGNAPKRSISCSSGHSWEIREWLTLRHLMDRQRKDVA
ncbi:hypothetical protein [Streptomyces sp. NL15-2K]|uniref:hypothetical protein n=1 Tax=Streptomyces sp. NL15-2K TaxID=376149 RepID=UPI000FF91A7E|nr:MULTISPECIES: hypothetical protein [Actinomycetes]WKX13935.1 hypothetical protein Q4V64_42990 [Kutzneria buriramensis]GCB50877.1 hypothetical protein SNL152K_8224 [Streptomyces sp. NL15-2K]